MQPIANGHIRATAQIAAPARPWGRSGRIVACDWLRAIVRQEHYSGANADEGRLWYGSGICNQCLDAGTGGTLWPGAIADPVAARKLGFLHGLAACGAASLRTCEFLAGACVVPPNGGPISRAWGDVGVRVAGGDPDP